MKSRSALFLLISGAVAALLLALLIIAPLLSPPPGDLQLLVAFMGTTGLATIAFVYLLYQRRALQRFTSLRWTLLATSILTVLLVFVNVFLTAKSMYISEHDLVLTTALLVFAGVISVISVQLISSTITERIHDLMAAARRVAKGDFSARAATEGNDELAELAKTFNDMAADLESVDEQKRLLEQTRRDLIAWVSHDLRTPLTAMRVMNEAMIDGVVTDEATISRYHHSIGTEIQHLSHLIDDLFELSRLDTGHFQIERQMTALDDLISDTIGSMSARASDVNVQLSGQVEPGIRMVNIAPDKIQRVLYNLLDNALHYTPPGGQVTLTAEQSNGSVCVKVHNSGSWIAPEDLPNIFTSFYRGERSRAQGSDGYRGTGLGLAIARGFVEAHGGHIHAESAPENGTTFTFTLPV
jgi:signal transduction histidine kinase